MTQARTKKDETAVAAAPVADAPVKAAPVKAAPVKAAPVKKAKTSTPKKESEHPPYKVRCILNKQQST